MDIQQQRLNLLKSHGFNPKFILDIGACIGEWAIMAKKIFHNSDILMFEPNDKNEEKLKKTGYPYRLSLIGNKSKEVEYYAIKEFPGVYNTGNSMFKEKTIHFSGNRFEVQKKQMVTLDEELLYYNNNNPPDFLKADVQGAELLILEGAKKTMETLEFVLLEASLLEYNENAPLFGEINHKMDEYGFQLYDILGWHYFKDQTLFQLDVLYCRKDSKYIKRNFK